MPAQAGIQAFQLRSLAYFLDSRFRGNDVSSFLLVKTYSLKGPQLLTPFSYALFFPSPILVLRRP